MAHVRRKYVAAEESGDARATLFLDAISLMDQVEALAKQVARVIAAGVPYQTPLDPPPADRRAAHADAAAVANLALPQGRV